MLLGAAAWHLTIIEPRYILPPSSVACCASPRLCPLLWANPRLILTTLLLVLWRGIDCQLSRHPAVQRTASPSGQGLDGMSSVLAPLRTALAHR
ncbi:hypothetical protein GQ53DRAFT_755160 [Thozetella sp. PMI_491]|nr:hypothetical protein GQ53DRAFT_755160 [Thozetella sp. PMI_491]